ncbi:MAG: glycosyltransferase family 4 protein [Parcubacteria group bacterium]|nr:glycosyltransferase family 4 protein [Parcubacteria group bacterium]
MNLLIITQKVDSQDETLGFFYHWLLEFAKQSKKLTVICLEEGAHDLPKNVRVFSLGKEKKRSRILYLWRFFRIIWKERHQYEKVFVHMNPEYVVLGGDLWRLLRRRIGLWYVHRNVDLKLRIAEKLAHVIWSTTPEAFRLKSKKVRFVGHGIDVSLFPRKSASADSHVLQILHVGRITAIKNLDILIEALAIIQSRGEAFHVKLVGVPTTPSDSAYERTLKLLVEARGLKDKVTFVGKVPFVDMGKLYREADVSLNLTPTGGMDKAVLESIASGTLALSANKAFADLFGEYAGHLLYNERDARDTANQILSIMNMDKGLRQKMEDQLSTKVREQFALSTLIKRIVEDLKES